MARSTERPVVVARVSFERTRLGPQCLVEAYARLVPIARKTVRGSGAGAAPVAAARPARPVATGRGLSRAECRAAFDARVSSEAQARANTITSQLAALRERIAADGATLTDPDHGFVDDGHSGASLVRPALERLRDAVAAGAVDRVDVLAPDRLARRHAHQALLVEEFRRAGVEVSRSSTARSAPAPRTTCCARSRA